MKKQCMFAMLLFALFMTVDRAGAQFTNQCTGSTAYSAVTLLIDTNTVVGATVFQIKGLTAAQLVNSTYCVNVATQGILTAVGDTSTAFGTVFVTSYYPDIVVPNQRSGALHWARVTINGSTTCCYLKVTGYTSGNRFVGGTNVWTVAQPLPSFGPPPQIGAHFIGNGIYKKPVKGAPVNWPMDK